MKRVIGILVMAALSLGILTGCGKIDNDKLEIEAYKITCKTSNFDMLTLSSREFGRVHVKGKVLAVIDEDGKNVVVFDAAGDGNVNKAVRIFYDGDNVKENNEIEVWGEIVNYRLFNEDGSQVYKEGTKPIPDIQAKYIEVRKIDA